jgi:hypothetical protein
MQSSNHFESFAANCVAMIADASADPDIQEPEDIWVLEVLEKEGAVNPYTQQPLVVEDSPGNLTIERENGEITRITFYRKNGAAYEW